MQLSVPYFSQHLHVEDPYWKTRACSVSCLKMIMEFYGVSGPSIDDLIAEGIGIRPYDEAVGWYHDVIVFLAHNHGLTAYREEFKSLDAKVEKNLVQRGLTKIRRQLATGRPVIVSAVKHFKEKHKHHTVVLTGFETKNEQCTGFYYHDPDALVEEEGNGLFVSFEDFNTYWRKLAIFAY